jgi:hypothetical protein
MSKGKAIAVQTWTGSEGSRRLRTPISRQSTHEGRQPYALTISTTQELFLVLISVRGRVDPRAIVRPEEVCK